MVVEISHQGFSAWISVDNEPLPIYNVQTTGSQCTGWIPSKVGQHFTVSWQDKSGDRIATSGHVFLDGRDVASAIMRPGRSKPVERSGIKTSSRRIKPFRFSTLTLTDDDSIASMFDPALEHMGTIKIEISRVKLGSETRFKGYQVQEHGVIHEKAKKLGAHCTSFGPSQRTDLTRTVAVTTVPYDKNRPGPYVIFLFKYRSADLLKAMGVVSNGKPKTITQPVGEVIAISDSEDENETPVRKKQRLRKSDKGSDSDEPDHGEHRKRSGQDEDHTFNFGTASLLREVSQTQSQNPPSGDDEASTVSSLGIAEDNSVLEKTLAE